MRPDIDIRSYLDTRSAQIVLIISVLAITAAAALIGILPAALLPDQVIDIDTTVTGVTLPLGLIIPAVAVVMTAGEWSDRSIQTTFLQRPSRLAVGASKVLSATVVVGAILVFSFAAAALFTWIGGDLVGPGSDFSTMDRVLTVQLSVMAATFFFALAMGVLTQSTVAGVLIAIGVPFVINTTRAIAVMMESETVEGVMRAVDLQGAAAMFGDGQAEAFDILPLLIMVILPLAIGAWRWNRREIG